MPLSNCGRASRTSWYVCSCCLEALRSPSASATEIALALGAQLSGEVKSLLVIEAGDDTGTGEAHFDDYHDQIGRIVNEGLQGCIQQGLVIDRRTGVQK
jgi:hypothetical protein